MTILRSSLPSGDSVPSEQFKRLLKQLERQRPGPTCWERVATKGSGTGSEIRRENHLGYMKPYK